MGNGEANKKTLALFDFDGTMIRGDSILAYLRLALRRKALSCWEYAKITCHTIRYLMKLETDEQIKTRALRFRRDMAENRRDALDAAFVEEELLPRVYPAARARLEKHQKAGHITLLVTASTENYMIPAAKNMGFDAVLATPIGEDGIVHHNCKGEEKVRRIKEWLASEGVQADFAASCAYGDSKSDLPMLRLAGHPTLVNPKRALRRAAPDMQREDWQVSSGG